MMKRLSREISCKTLGCLLIVLTIQIAAYFQGEMQGLLFISYGILILLLLASVISWGLLIVWLLTGGIK